MQEGPAIKQGLQVQQRKRDTQTFALRKLANSLGLDLRLGTVCLPHRNLYIAKALYDVKT